MIYTIKDFATFLKLQDKYVTHPITTSRQSLDISVFLYDTVFIINKKCVTDLIKKYMEVSKYEQSKCNIFGR